MRREQIIILSELPHTWLFDIDGTLAFHNGYKNIGKDVPIEGSLAFLRKIPEQDVVVLLTSRTEDCREITENFLKRYHIRYNYILFGLPVGERILINDKKPSGLAMAHSLNVERDQGIEVELIINKSL